MKYEIQSDYQYVKPLIENIEKYFQKSADVLHDKRNEIRVVSFDSEKYVVKAFRVPNFINRIVYRYFRPSKAKRSYQYSIRVGADLCPEAVAFIEENKGFLLSKSYYISRHFDYDFEIRAVLNNKKFKNRTQILEELAEFTHVLHEKNILHRDYSPGNILIKKVGEQYLFKIVDVNRMQFKTLTLEERLSNFVRLSADDEAMKVIIYRYAQCIQKPAEEMLVLAKKYSDEYEAKRALKNKLRGRS